MYVCMYVGMWPKLVVISAIARLDEAVGEADAGGLRLGSKARLAVRVMLQRLMDSSSADVGPSRAGKESSS